MFIREAGAVNRYAMLRPAGDVSGRLTICEILITYASLYMTNITRVQGIGS